MIENGVVTYGAIDEGILTWRFSNDILNEVVIAALLTIISYQTVEILINVSFGLKDRGRATLSDIQIMLFIRRSSPISILRTIIPRRTDATMDLVDDMSETSVDTRCIGFRGFVYVKLFCLLLAIPLINVGSVVLSLEREKDLTFAEGNFGGLAFGVVLNPSLIPKFSLISRIPQAFCEGTTLQTNSAENPIALFRSCTRELPRSNDANRNNTFILAVSSTPVEIVFVSVTLGSKKIIYEKRMMIVSDTADKSPLERNGQLYYVKPNFNVAEVEVLVNRVAKRAQGFCDLSAEADIVKDTTQGPGAKFTVAASGVCPRESEGARSEDLEIANTLALDILKHFSFVDGDELMVRSGEDEQNTEFFSGDGLLLLSRQRALVSIPIMAILALAVVLLRIITQLATNNDLERGIGLIVRDGLGLPCCDSMLCSPDVVAQYDSKGLILYDVNRSYEEAELLEGKRGNSRIRQKS